ncbi:MAG: cytochrome c oxidase subunit II [Candidatus Promineifilaceae bacterium]|nr:cytochrome c oxidase subunit II [Candidatus Promineifilaceae bacterium]
MKYRKHFTAIIVITPVVALLTYLVLNAIYKLPIAASEEAVIIEDMFQAHFILISALFALVMTFMFYSIFAFRRQPGDEEDGDHFHGNTVLEIVWTVVPLVIVLFFGYWGAVMLSDITAPEPDEMVVEVYGQQWSWYYIYPEMDDMRTSELVLPAGEQIRLEMTALDVLHSFWVPEFRVKQDLVPGQIHHLRITPTIPGEYRLRCAEICGVQHAYMLGDVIVLSPDEFEEWVEESELAGEPVPAPRTESSVAGTPAD